MTRVVKSAEDSDEGDDRVVDGVSRCPPGLYLAEETARAFFFVFEITMRVGRKRCLE